MVDEIDVNEFQELIQDDSNLLVIDFWAEWCVPCKISSPKFEMISEKFPQTKFVKINADKQPLIAESFGVRGIPAFFILKGKQVLGVVNGADMKKVEEMVRNEVEALSVAV